MMSRDMLSLFLGTNMKKTLIIALIPLTLIGCATTNEQNMQMPTAQKPVGPGLTSPEINALMDSNDRAKVRQFVATATKEQHLNWQSATHGTQFDLTSLNIFVNDEGLPCRDYKAMAANSSFLANRNLQVKATACRQADSRWRLISSNEPQT